MSTAVVVGSDADTAKVAAGLGLMVADAAGMAPAVVVVSNAADLDALREAARAGVSIAAAIALRLDETHVVALYDLGLPVAFGFCSRAALDEAISACPDADARSVAAALAAIEAGLR